MDFLELRETLRLRLDAVGATGFYSDSELNTYINRGLVALSELVPVATNIVLNITAGEARYEISDNVVDVSGITLSSGESLNCVPDLSVPREYIAAGHDIGTVPRYYIKADRIIYIFPTPAIDHTATLYYTRLATPLTLNTDEPELGERYHFLIIHYAAWLCLTKISATAVDETAKNFLALGQSELAFFQSNFEAKDGWGCKK
jgi:hypothetical protein